MIRWLNLAYIAVTQVLFQYCVAVPLFKNSSFQSLSDISFGLIVLSSVLIAAAGYIINDYFDINIDQVNKPGKIVVDTIISRRWALFFHMIFSMTGVLLGFYVGWKDGAISIGFGNLTCVILLWFYSTTFKRKLLSGNIIISLLTAWVIMVLHVATIDQGNFILQGTNAGLVNKFTRVAVLYTAFAFIVSLIREVIKDMEDMEGDERYGCRTMPVVWGVNVSKVFAAVWIIVLAACLLIVQFYVILQFKWWLSALYCLVFVITPLLWILFNLRRSYGPAEFHRLSAAVKIVMLTGVLSLLFFRYLL
jgi:4-hydroxybenzoate polyprenyltransferase